MTKADFERHANQFARVARTHDQCVDAGIVSIGDSYASLYLVLEVEMPLSFADIGQSPNGVRTEERVELFIGPRYPWRSPQFYLRSDFPRGLPHLSSAGGMGDLPRPCLVDGSGDEYFASFGLIEIGIQQLISQMCAWLAKAATNSLMDPAQGWESVMRHDLPDGVLLDPDAVRGRVANKEGSVWLKSKYVRFSGEKAGDPEITYITVSEDLAPSVGALRAFPFNVERGVHGNLLGDTITAVFWPPVGNITDVVLPEIIETLDDLATRCTELGCGRVFKEFLARLEKRWAEAPWTSHNGIPIGVILCVRRPFKLIGRSSSVELLPYCFNVYPKAKRNTLFEGGTARRVLAARQLDKTTPRLMRHVSGAGDLGKVAMIGAGSVGSKVAMHLARSGVTITAVSDSRNLQPHNLARHALVRSALPWPKAYELASELEGLGQKPATSIVDVVASLQNKSERSAIVPDGSSWVVNTTASLLVRDALSVVPTEDLPARISEAALFGKGRGAFILQEGRGRNPTIADLEIAMSSHADKREKELLFDPRHGLSEIQIGDGCGSLTMQMTDARLSGLVAHAAEQLCDLAAENPEPGTIAIAVSDETSPTTQWRRIIVPKMIEVPVEGGDWTLKIAADVDERIRRDVAAWPGVETGGLLMGACSSRIRTITVVDLLPAPADSTRSPALFVLGKKGLRHSIMQAFEASGKRLLDVGTWHNHLADHGPSATDRATAKDLTSERSPPAVLLIITPARYFAIVQRIVDT